jgi:hypothetical protein
VSFRYCPRFCEVERTLINSHVAEIFACEKPPSSAEAIVEELGPSYQPERFVVTDTKGQFTDWTISHGYTPIPAQPTGERVHDREKSVAGGWPRLELNETVMRDNHSKAIA